MRIGRVRCGGGSRARRAERVAPVEFVELLFKARWVIFVHVCFITYTSVINGLHQKQTDKKGAPEIWGAESQMYSDFMVINPQVLPPC